MTLALVEKALKLHQNGDLTGAEALYMAALGVNPHDADALHLLGSLRRATGRPEDAIELITRALALLPDFAEAYYNLGNAQADLGRLDEAARSYQEALKARPDWHKAKSSLAEVGRKNQLLMKTKDSFNRDHASGRWAYLARSPAEAARLGAVAGYIRQFSPEGLVLDLGCGEAALLEHLGGDVAIGRYIGVDISDVALSRAHIRRPSASLVSAAIEQYPPDRAVDVLVFNEVLYYLDDPLTAFCRYRHWLTPQGVAIVSWYKSGGEGPDTFARSLSSAGWEIVDQSILTNADQRLSWTILVARPAD